MSFGGSQRASVVGSCRCDVSAAHASSQQPDLLWLLVTGFTGAVRFALCDVLLHLRFNQHQQQLGVAIYGAGEAATQLAAGLRLA